MYLIILFILIGSICISLRKHIRHVSYSNLPPGKTGFPLVGESFAFLSAGRQGHPEKFITDRLRRFCSSASGVFKTHILGSPTVVVTGASGNKFLFTNENKLVVSWWPDSVNKIFPSSLETSSKEEAKKLRTHLLQFLKPEALRRYVGDMDEIAGRHFETEWENHDQLLVFPLTKKFTFSVACRLFLSMDDPERIKKLQEPFNTVAVGVLSVPINLPGTRFNRAIKASRSLRKEVSAIIRGRREEVKAGKTSSEQDILSHLLMSSIGESKDEHLADKIIGLLIGGHDTASIVCTFIVNFLADFPHVYERVQQEQKEIVKEKEGEERLKWEDIEKMRYSWNVACEVMRIVPPLSGTFREAIDHFSFKGFYIPKGWKLYWSAIATHKNPDYFPEPEKFEPNRFEGNGPKPYTYVPFGGGPRMCPGREFARLEILIFMHNLVKRFKWEKLFTKENIIIVDPLPIPHKDLPIRLFPTTLIKD